MFPGVLMRTLGLFLTLSTLGFAQEKPKLTQAENEAFLERIEKAWKAREEQFQTFDVTWEMGHCIPKVH